MLQDAVLSGHPVLVAVGDEEAVPLEGAVLCEGPFDDQPDLLAEHLRRQRPGAHVNPPALPVDHVELEVGTAGHPHDRPREPRGRPSLTEAPMARLPARWSSVGPQ